MAELTAREREVALLVAKGATNSEVATHLAIAVKTVEFHLAQIYRKVGVRSRTELAWRMARDDGGDEREGHARHSEVSRNDVGRHPRTSATAERDPRPPSGSADTD